MLKFAIGSDDFQNIMLNGCYYVDKTSYIKHLIDNKHIQVKLITRPRRFGKTLTLSMIDNFFSIAHKNMHSTFEKLDIGTYDEKYLAMQGQYPVINITLKDINGDSHSDLMASIASIIARTYRDHRYLLDSNAIYPEDKDYFNDILKQKCPTATLHFALYNLSQFLHEHHNKKVILLIDEYDAPMQTAWTNQFYDKTISFFRALYNTSFKSNSHLEFAIITGITRIAKESIFSGLNNLDIYTVTDKRLSGLIGFTANEVAKLSSDAGCIDKLPEIKEWYDGYQFGDTEIYNPWSILKYFSMKYDAQPYWANTSSNDIIHQLLHRCDEEQSTEILALVKGESLYTTLNEGTVYSDIFNSRSTLYTMMLSTGYLKAVSANSSKTIYEVKIPNKEIMSIYKDEIIIHMGDNLEFTMDSLPQIMISGNVQKFQAELQKILKRTASYHDMAREPEIFYHGLLLGLTVTLTSSYTIKSNRESGYGRFDLAFFPRKTAPKTALGIIMEFKKADSSDETAMNSACDTALKQIKNNEYTAEFTSHHISNVLMYGIAFSGKHVKIKKL